MLTAREEVDDRVKALNLGATIMGFHNGNATTPDDLRAG